MHAARTRKRAWAGGQQDAGTQTRRYETTHSLGARTHVRTRCTHTVHAMNAVHAVQPHALHAVRTGGARGTRSARTHHVELAAHAPHVAHALHMARALHVTYARMRHTWCTRRMEYPRMSVSGCDQVVWLLLECVTIATTATAKTLWCGEDPTYPFWHLKSSALRSAQPNSWAAESANL